MRLFIIFIFLLSNSFAKEVPNIKNIVINEELKTYKNLAFLENVFKVTIVTLYIREIIIYTIFANMPEYKPLM